MKIFSHTFCRRARLLGTVLLAASCALPPVPLAAQNLPDLGGSERDALSPARERWIADQVKRSLHHHPHYLSDGTVLEYLNGLGSTLLAGSPDANRDTEYDFFFFAVRAPDMNAFALPGGLIGMHSGLLLAAETESELAGVLAHEIGHVSQRHLARREGGSAQQGLLTIATILLAALAAGSSSDLANAALLGGSELALRRELGFSREVEREADRIGLQMLRNAGFDPAGMVAMFERMQRAEQVYSSSMPAYLRTHPLNTDRIADIKARLQDERYRQRIDSLDFHLVRARVRVLQDDTAPGWHEAEGFFNSRLQHPALVQQMAAKYGLALIASRQGKHGRAQELLQQLRSMRPQAARYTGGEPLSSLAIEIRLAAGQGDQALKEAEAARAQLPLSRSIARKYAEALIAAGRRQQALDYLRDQILMYRQEAPLHQLLAKVYAAQGKRALQHMALAEYYALTSSLPAALDQLTLARRAGDASFHDQSVIDAREREFRQRWLEELKEREKR